MTCIRDVSMTPCTIFLPIEASLCRSARPTKKPDIKSPGVRLELPKQVPKNLLSVESDKSVTQNLQKDSGVG
jgi:hypothetical protein